MAQQHQGRVTRSQPDTNEVSSLRRRSPTAYWVLMIGLAAMVIGPVLVIIEAML